MENDKISITVNEQRKIFYSEKGGKKVIDTEQRQYQEDSAKLLADTICYLAQKLNQTCDRIERKRVIRLMDDMSLLRDRFMRSGNVF